MAIVCLKDVEYFEPTLGRYLWGKKREMKPMPLYNFPSINRLTVVVSLFVFKANFANKVLQRALSSTPSLLDT